MKIYGCNRMEWSNILAPNFKDNDVFYVVYDGKIMAVKITHSYLKLREDNSADLIATFKTPNGRTRLDTEGRLIISHKKAYTSLCVEGVGMTPIYDTTANVKNNIKSSNYVDITRFPIINKGYEYAAVEVCGWDYYINTYYWSYYQSNYQPSRFSSKANNLIWSKDGYGLILSNKEKPLPNKKWSTETEVLDYLSELKDSMEIVGFPEEEKPEEVSDKKVTLTIEVTADMSLNDIAMLIAKQMDGKAEE